MTLRHAHVSSEPFSLKVKVILPRVLIRTSLLSALRLTRIALPFGNIATSSRYHPPRHPPFSYPEVVLPAVRYGAVLGRGFIRVIDFPTSRAVQLLLSRVYQRQRGNATFVRFRG